MALGLSIFVPLAADFLSKSCTNLEFLIEPSVCPHKKQSYQGVGRVASIHRAAEKGNSRKFVSTILHIQVYEGGDMRLCPTPMDRMLPQDVVSLDGYTPRCIDAHRVDLHPRRGLHQFPRIALQAVLTPSSPLSSFHGVLWSHLRVPRPRRRSWYLRLL